MSDCVLSPVAAAYSSQKQLQQESQVHTSFIIYQICNTFTTCSIQAHNSILVTTETSTYESSKLLTVPIMQRTMQHRSTVGNMALDNSAN